MNCPYCGEEMLYREDMNYYICGKDFTEVWPPDKPERGAYKKNINVTVSISSPDCMLWHQEDMNYKPPLPPGVPHFKGGGSKSGRKRKKPQKKLIVYET